MVTKLLPPGRQNEQVQLSAPCGGGSGEGGLACVHTAMDATSEFLVFSFRSFSIIPNCLCPGVASVLSKRIKFPAVLTV